jgi:hypothetical protein
MNEFDPVYALKLLITLTMHCYSVLMLYVYLYILAPFESRRTYTLQHRDMHAQ